MFLQSNLTLRQGLVVTLLHLNIDVQLTINYQREQELMTILLIITYHLGFLWVWER